MIRIAYQKKFLQIAQIWYLQSLSQWQQKEQGKEQGKEKADLIFFHGIDKAEPLDSKIEKHASCTDFHSLLTDLSQSEEELLQQINKSERYQIRKSERDGGTVSFFTGQQLQENETVISGLAAMYEELYREKGTPHTFNHAQFREYLKQQCIMVSCVYQEKTPLVFHSYVMDEKQARLLHSVSEFRNSEIEANVIGRANKRLHFEDLLYFKERGLDFYDWGGISSFENPNGIDVFKMKFGGTPVTYRNIIYGNTWLGKLGMFVMKVTGKKIG